MKTFVFAIASVTSLAAFVAAVSLPGCTSSDPPASSPADGGTDAKPTTKPTPPHGDDDDDVEAGTCMTDKEVDVSSVAYKPPAVEPGACDSGVIAVIEKFANENANATYEDLKATLAAQSDACAKCVFGEDGDTWAPIVEDSGKVVNVNVGGCIELASGNPACGKAYQQWNACLTEACKACSDSDADQCNHDAQQDGAACGKASADLDTVCGKDVNNYIGSCYRAGELLISGPIRAQCIESTIKDASTD